MNTLDIEPGHCTPLPTNNGMPDPVHLFEKQQILAINAAIAARRPLLLRGEPGIGKSQLARAAAVEMHRMFVSHVVDARSESRDLLWHFDAVARLADAQATGAAGRSPQPGVQTEPETDPQTAPQIDPQPCAKPNDEQDPLALVNYLHPGPLWWAFDWLHARQQAERVEISEPPQIGKPKVDNGCVVLIDEIDKAEADLPNGLLEALGAGCFSPQGLGESVQVGNTPPLVMITTNEERALPDAFVRRCLVLHLGLPKDDGRLKSLLVKRGQAHLKAYMKQPGKTIHPDLIERAAELLATDRGTARAKHWRPLPGQAEFFDLLWAVIEQRPKDRDGQLELIDEVACFLLKKHPDAADQLLADQDSEEDGLPA